MPRDWDAATYDRVADPQFRWGATVIGRLEVAGDETVLDAGCGSGRVTELLLERLPAGNVVALDGSASMLGQARTRLGRFGERVTFVLADLGDLRTVVAALSELGADPFSRKVFATPEETSARLLAAGFVEIECWLNDEPTPFDDLDALETFLRTVALGEHVAAMREDEARAFAHEVAVRLPETALDYVRLNIQAWRAP